jgi:hypothetical protein
VLQFVVPATVASDLISPDMYNALTVALNWTSSLKKP